MYINRSLLKVICTHIMNDPLHRNNKWHLRFNTREILFGSKGAHDTPILFVTSL